MGWAWLVGVLVVALFAILAAAVTADTLATKRSESKAADRAHELELADREVAMWNVAKAAPRSFGEALVGGARPPRLVGRSQVLDSPVRRLDLTDKGVEVPLEACDRIDQHPGHLWLRAGLNLDEGNRWCDGMNADGTAPYDPMRAGYEKPAPS